jgi:hypothetical protein
MEVGDEAQDFPSDCRCDIFSDLYGRRVGDMEDRGVKRNPEIYVAVEVVPINLHINSDKVLLTDRICLQDAQILGLSNLNSDEWSLFLPEIGMSPVELSRSSCCRLSSWMNPNNL